MESGAGGESKGGAGAQQKENNSFFMAKDLNRYFIREDM